MAVSIYSKKLRTLRKVASGTGVAGTELLLVLNKDYLTEEHRISFVASQAYATTAPTSVDVRDFIKDITLEVSGGRHSGKVISVDGAQLYELSRFTEGVPKNDITLVAAGALLNQARFSVDVHHAQDDALRDFDTCLRSADYSTVTLRVNFNADTANGFKAGVGGGVTSYAVVVEAQCYPSMTPMTDAEKATFRQGSKYHRYDSFPQPIVGAGNQPDVRLKTGVKTRFLQIQTRNAAGALADGILDNIRFAIAGTDVVDCSFADIQQINAKDRGYVSVGTCFLDWGDDDEGFVDLQNVNEAKLQLIALAAGSVKVLQDYQFEV